MNYKKIIKRRSTRAGILRALRFIPDEPMIKLQYFIKMNRRLDLKNPRRFTEKMQWYKLYYRNPLMVRCADKADVREYVRSKGLEEILIPCIGVYDAPEQIDWDALPERFVLKDTLGGGGNAVILVRDKAKADRAALTQRMRAWVSRDVHRKSGGREWPYHEGKNSRIIIEELLTEGDSSALTEYKFFCFNGRTEFLYVMKDRKLGESVKLGIFGREFNKLPVLRDGDADIGETEKPANFDRMLEIAEILSADFPHVRVDLYSVGGAIRFGELTFFNASGYMKYTPDDFDIEIGDKWKLPEKNHR